MSEEKKPAYLYRKHPVNEQELYNLVETHIFAKSHEVHAFAGNSVELLPIHTCSKSSDVLLTSQSTTKPYPFDFGHIFSESIEIRWKRTGDNDNEFDVLILSETDLPAYKVDQLKGKWEYTPLQTCNIIQGGKSSKSVKDVKCIQYYAPNGVVQFVRYSV